MSVVTETPATETGRPAPAGDRQRWRTLREFARRPLGLAAAVFLILISAAVAAASWLAPYDPLAQDLGHTLSGPTGQHWLGSDQLGRDVLSRLLFGGQVTLIGVVEALAVAFVIGLPLGLAAGFLGGWVDAVVSRVTEVVMAIPAIVVLLMAYSVFDNNAHAGMLTLGLLSAPTLLRVSRGAARGVRAETFIVASEVVGTGRARIVLRHVLPNIWGPILVNTAMLAAINLGVQAGLNYLNLGVKPPAPSWGGLVAEAQINLQLQPWLVIPSGLTIALTIVAFILLADGLRDATSSRTSRAARSVTPATDRVRPVDEVEPAAGVLEVRHLDVHFGALRVVQDVSFSLQEREILGIVGESGCGKSVTVSAVLDSLGPTGRTTGSIKFDGTDLLTAPASTRAATRGRIAYVSQDPMVSLDPSFTIGAQLGEIVRTHDRSSRAAAQARVLELLTDVGLPDPPALMKKYPHQISGGQAQRVSIACALAGRPRVLVADEPTTALDVTVQGEILSLLRRLRDQNGMAIILITHDLGVIADLCDRVAVMYAGQIVETAPAGTLFGHPSHPYTKALIQANPIVAERGQLLPSIPGVVPAPADWPVGCHFYDRCAFRTPACAGQPIPLVPAGGADQAARCIHLDAVLGATS
ncbi:dipeptide/oligopeptide/nickel ABC transporter permease/ATP-binding protein [Actinoplanes sp. NPDC026619]|uniref:dipeptide/oligopeptide/nickel ABC transporter permease/ATP-binding protein n=1 Tax=Actinoplanes sp. NPDC026619 TaxID=3155798 RepID=UPI00340610F1